jgi:Phage protein Gp138 N-terminal domain
MTLENKSIADPDLTDVLTTFQSQIFYQMNCVKIGEIVSFDGTKKTAKIKILFKRVLANKTLESYPSIVDCPVFTLQGNGGAIQMPIAAGDQCIVLFSDRNIDNWFANGAEAAPANSRAHDISDGIAIVGINALNSSLEAYVSNQLRMFFAGAEINFDSGIITIKNEITTLMTLISGLIDVLKALEVTGPLPLTPAAIAALEAQKAIFQGLLG